MFAEVALIRKDKDTDRLFTYEIPHELKKAVKVGSKLLVPFGNGNSFLTGFVFNIIYDKPDFNTKIIKQLYAPIYELTEKQISLCRWMKARYSCTFAQAIKTIVPQELLKASKPAFYTKVYLSPLLDSNTSIEKAIPANARKQKKALQFLLDKKSVEESIFLKETGIGKKSMDSLVSKKLIVKKNISSRGFYRPSIYACQSNHHSERIVCMLDTPERENCYLHYIDESLKSNRSILVVSNEIEEAMRLHRNFSNKFKNVNSFVHNSNLPRKDLESIQKILLSNQTAIVFGTRNSLFLPFNELGTIIVDRESEYGHKSDTMPKFHSAEIAEALGKIHHCRIIYSDCTPSTRTFYEMSKSKPLVIGKKSNASKLVNSESVDMKLELKSGNRTMFGEKLFARIKQSAKTGIGTIILLNQKGHSTTIACKACGHAMKCPHCGLGLTYYSEDGMLRCSFCSYQTPSDTPCPECGNRNFKYFGVGPEKVKNELSSRIPEIRTLILNKKTVPSTSALKAAAESFNRGEHDVLISTEIILKTDLVKRPVIFAILNADMFLDGQDFMANERFFSLVRKIRSCINNKRSELFIQTYDVNQMAVAHSIKNDYMSFYKDEMEIRKSLRLPPFYNMAVFHVFGNVDENVKLVAESYCAALKKLFAVENAGILGPSKRNGLRYKSSHKYQIVVRYAQVDIRRLMGIIKYVNEKQRDEFRKLSVRLSYDIDARNL